MAKEKLRQGQPYRTSILLILKVIGGGRPDKTTAAAVVVVVSVGGDVDTGGEQLVGRPCLKAMSSCELKGISNTLSDNPCKQRIILMSGPPP